MPVIMQRLGEGSQSRDQEIDLGFCFPKPINKLSIIIIYYERNHHCYNQNAFPPPEVCPSLPQRPPPPWWWTWDDGDGDEHEIVIVVWRPLTCWWTGQGSHQAANFCQRWDLHSPSRVVFPLFSIVHQKSSFPLMSYSKTSHRTQPGISSNQRDQSFLMMFPNLRKVHFYGVGPYLSMICAHENVCWKRHQN